MGNKREDYEKENEVKDMWFEVGICIALGWLIFKSMIISINQEITVKNQEKIFNNQVKLMKRIAELEGE